MKIYCSGNKRLTSITKDLKYPNRKSNLKNLIENQFREFTN